MVRSKQEVAGTLSILLMVTRVLMAIASLAMQVCMDHTWPHLDSEDAYLGRCLGQTAVWKQVESWRLVGMIWLET